jgi:hypothetical protein
MIRKWKFSLVLIAALVGAVALSGCEATIDKDQDYPEENHWYNIPGDLHNTVI